MLQPRAEGLRPIGISAMGDLLDADDERFIVDPVDDPIVTDADAILIRTAHFLAAVGPGVIGKRMSLGMMRAWTSRGSEFRPSRAGSVTTTR